MKSKAKQTNLLFPFTTGASSRMNHVVIEIYRNRKLSRSWTTKNLSSITLHYVAAQTKRTRRKIVNLSLSLSWFFLQRNGKDSIRLRSRGVLWLLVCVNILWRIYAKRNTNSVPISLENAYDWKVQQLGQIWSIFCSLLDCGCVLSVDVVALPLERASS